MTDAPAAAAGIGHNQGVFSQEALALLRAALDPFKARRDQFLAAAKKVEIRDRHDAGAAADVIGLARDVAKLIEAHRERIAGPHDAAVKAVTGYARAFWDDVVNAMADIQAKIDTFAAAERTQIRLQEEEQRRDEARRRTELAGTDKPAPAPPPPTREPKRRSYRGDYGRQAVVGDEIVIEITDVRALPDLVLKSDRVTEAIKAVLKPMVRNGMKIDGIETSTRAKTSIRK